MNRGDYVLIFSSSYFLVLLLFHVALITEGKETTMRAIVQDEPGGPQTMKLGHVPRPTVGATQVLIQVHYTALNRADTLQRKGAYPPPPGESNIMGLETAGVIEAIGSGCTRGFKQGDQVMALLAGGGYAEYVVVDERLVMHVPQNVDLKSAAAIPEVWLTAFQLLHVLGKLKAGERVLIHAGGSGVGTAAVQLTRLAGATSLVTAGTDEKLSMAQSLGASAGFNYKSQGTVFSDWVLERTKGEGVQLVLDCVGGSYWDENLKCLSLDSRWVLYGLLGGPSLPSGDSGKGLLGKILRKRITLMGSTLRTRSLQYKAELIERFSRDALPHFSTGKLKPIVDSVYPLEQIQAAHEAMDKNVNTGKIMIQVKTNADQPKSEL